MTEITTSEAIAMLLASVEELRSTGVLTLHDGTIVVRRRMTNGETVEQADRCAQGLRDFIDAGNYTSEAKATAHAEVDAAMSRFYASMGVLQ